MSSFSVYVQYAKNRLRIDFNLSWILRGKNCSGAKPADRSGWSTGPYFPGLEFGNIWTKKHGLRLWCEEKFDPAEKHFSMRFLSSLPGLRAQYLIIIDSRDCFDIKVIWTQHIICTHSTKDCYVSLSSSNCWIYLIFSVPKILRSGFLKIMRSKRNIPQKRFRKRIQNFDDMFPYPIERNQIFEFHFGLVADVPLLFCTETCGLCFPGRLTWYKMESSSLQSLFSVIVLGARRQRNWQFGQFAWGLDLLRPVIISKFLR